MSIIRQVEICQCKNSFHEFTFYDHRNGKSILENSKLLRTCIFLKIMFIFHTNAKTYIKWIFHSVCYHLLLYCKLHSIIQGWSFKIPHLVFACLWSTKGFKYATIDLDKLKKSSITIANWFLCFEVIHWPQKRPF